MQRSRDLSLASILSMQAISINNYFKDSSGLQIKAPLKLYRYAVQLLVRSRIFYRSAFRLHCSDELSVTLLAPPVCSTFSTCYESETTPVPYRFPFCKITKN